MAEEKEIYVISGAHTKALAKQLSGFKGFVPGKIVWGRFEDDFPNIFIENVENMKGKDVVLFLSFLDHMELFPQLSLLYSLPKYGIKSLTIILPYFPTGTMERIDEEGQIPTAVTFSRLLNSTPLSFGGTTKLIMFDIHALQNRFYFSDKIIPILLSGIPLLLSIIKLESKNMTIVFPDDGAHKRFGKLFSDKDFKIAICSKVRVGNERQITIKEGKEFIEGQHCLIVDDLVKTGGTLLSTRKALMSFGAEKVSGYVTHAIFPKKSWLYFLNNVNDTKNNWDSFYVTDSCPESILDIQKIDPKDSPFKIISLVTTIRDAVLKVL